MTTRRTIPELRIPAWIPRAGWPLPMQSFASYYLPAARPNRARPNPGIVMSSSWKFPRTSIEFTRPVTVKGSNTTRASIAASPASPDGKYPPTLVITIGEKSWTRIELPRAVDVLGICDNDPRDAARVLCDLALTHGAHMTWGRCDTNAAVCGIYTNLRRIGVDQ